MIRTGRLADRRLPKACRKETADLFEVADEISSGALAGGGVEFEVGRSDLQPGICGGRQAGGKGDAGEGGPRRRANRTGNVAHSCFRVSSSAASELSRMAD
jgi:hypothetical protein